MQKQDDWKYLEAFVHNKTIYDYCFDKAVLYLNSLELQILELYCLQTFALSCDI